MYVNFTWEAWEQIIKLATLQLCRHATLACSYMRLHCCLQSVIVSPPSAIELEPHDWVVMYSLGALTRRPQEATELFRTAAELEESSTDT